MKKPTLFVANWKMNMPLEQALSFIRDNTNALQNLTSNGSATIVICPSFPFLILLGAEVIDSNLLLGAQNCSEYAHGSFTGQVSARMLADVGCDFCIIGHSECRSAFNETDISIANKAVQLTNAQITPIVCIGETADQYSLGTTQQALTAQLTPLIAAVKNYTGELCIAYEPRWAIGTGKTPTKTELTQIFQFLAGHMATQLPTAQITLLYGGSVDETNAQEILSITPIGGLLIGGASLTFQKFQKIVSLAK